MELLHGAMFLLLIYGVKAFGPAQSEPMCDLNSRFDCNVCREGKGVCAVRGVTVSLLILYNQTHKSFDSPRNSLICSSLSPFLCFFFIFFFMCVSSPDVACHVLLGGPELRRKSSGPSQVAAQQFGHFSPYQTPTPPLKRERERKKREPIRQPLSETHSMPHGAKRVERSVCVFENQRSATTVFEQRLL